MRAEVADQCEGLTQLYDLSHEDLGKTLERQHNVRAD